MTSSAGPPGADARPDAAGATWWAPGRVNLIGEHTDYNDGFAMPFAIDAGCAAGVTVVGDDRLRISSVQREGEDVDVALGDLAPGGEGWSGYVAGVVWALRERGHDLPGLRIVVDSDVPVGSGLSSSAALVCSVATALDDALGLGLDDDALLEVTRRAENDFVGAPTGGMDQLASLRCTAGHALFCDMRSLDVEQVPFDPGADGLVVLVVDTRAEHSHADGEYASRRSGCERAAEALGVRALRDVGVDDLDAALARLEEEELRRYVRHVVTEDDRVVRTADLLRAGRLREIGALMVASHASMREDYRITIDELDVAVETLMGAGAIGARMTGGGFGGCVIALVPVDDADGLSALVAAAFAERGFREPAHFTVSPGRGAHRAARRADDGAGGVA